MGSVSRISALLGLTVATAYLVQPYKAIVVRGQSMEPTLTDGQLLITAPLQRSPKDGDIVLISHDGSTLIKRVAMVPGDRYEEAYVPFAHQWMPIHTEAVRKMVDDGRLPSRILTVPPGMMWVLGDNPAVSLDSRTFGFVPTGSVEGIVTLAG